MARYPRSIHAFALPARGDVEKLARRFYGLLSSRNGSSGNGAETKGPATGIRDRDSEVEQLAESLATMLLEPVADALRGKRLVIVPDGVLCLYPVRCPGAAGSARRRYTPLAATNTISSLPSASALPIIRMQDTKRATPPKMVAVIGDPVFDQADARVRRAEGGSRGAKPSDADLSDHPETRAARRPRLAGWFSHAARRSRSTLYSPPNSRRSPSTSEPTWAPSRLRKWPNTGSFILPTHGFLDSEHPDRSALVLSFG